MPFCIWSFLFKAPFLAEELVIGVESVAAVGVQWMVDIVVGIEGFTSSVKKCRWMLKCWLNVWDVEKNEKMEEVVSCHVFRVDLRYICCLLCSVTIT